MNHRSAALALVFSSVGHFFAHLLMLLWPTVILVLEGQWGMSYGDLLSLSLGGNGTVGSIGLAAAPFVAGALAQLISWRAAFIIPAVVCTAIGVALLCCVRSSRVIATRIDRSPEPPATRSDVARTFVVLSF